MSAPVINYVVHYAITIALFYLQSGTILPWIGKKKWQWLWIPLFCIVFLLMYILAHWLGEIFLTHLLQKPIKPFYGMTWPSFLRNGYRGLYFMGFSTGYYYLYSFIRQRKHAQELETQRLLAIIQQQQTQRELDVMQNAFLKAQINPHFLFNMLNGIKATMRTDTEKAETMIFKLSDFLRYQLYENTADKTFFKSELDFLTNLIELEKTRRENFAISITTAIPQVEINSLLIPPNLFTIFVENAIKHSVAIGLEESYVNVHFEKIQHRLCFTCTNTKDPVYSNSINKKPGGIGLVNIRRRLELLYGDDCQLQTIADEHTHTVKLSIPL